MRLIGLAVVLILSLALVPLAAEGQEAGKVSRIGLLGYSAGWEPFRQALRDLGYAEGRNIAIEYRLTEGAQERLHEHAAELVRLKVDVLVTARTPPTQAAGRIIDFVAKSRLPAMYQVPDNAVAGGLMAYGASLP